MQTVWSRPVWTAWGTVTVLAVLIAVASERFLVVGVQAGMPDMVYHLSERAWATYLHFFVSPLVLLIGPFQFLRSVRERRPRIHRWLGRIYVAGCILGGLAGLVLARNVDSGPVAAAGFSTLAVLWLGTTVVAYLKARNRRFAEHRQWMIRSYALAFAAVTLRLQIPIAVGALGLEYDASYRAISFLCWVPNLLIAELVARRWSPVGSRSRTAGEGGPAAR